MEEYDGCTNQCRRYGLDISMLFSCSFDDAALAFFYGGMVRRKNVLSTLTLSYIFMSLIGVQWVLYDILFAFGPTSAD